MADRISLKQLARELGLSESTVSKALNGRRDVSAEVRERVRALADALGYAPDPAARGLATGKRGAIGVYLLNRF
ncbi:MAG TPA: LacI family DNA-binding transcriptional regulator, partial [Treponemataceae bacterium]|nr:LacI family DNA-binding transcriptional regulator [Treponemataceae bacterium]